MDLLTLTIKFESGTFTKREMLTYFSELIRRKKLDFVCELNGRKIQRYYYNGIIHKLIDYGVFDEEGNINIEKFFSKSVIYNERSGV